MYGVNAQEGSSGTSVLGTMTVTQAAERSSIQREFEKLQGQANAFVELAALLGKRLQPVLRAATPTPANRGNEVEASPQCELATGLRQVHGSNVATIERLQELLNLLDV